MPPTECEGCTAKTSYLEYNKRLEKWLCQECTDAAINKRDEELEERRLMK